jgi:hypothetical protein
MNTENWRPIDYLTLILMHMSEANEHISMNEMQHMAHKIGTDRVVGMRQLLEDISLAKQQEMIRKLRPKFYPGSFGKKALVEQIHELFDIDGVISDREEQLLHSLDGLL